MDAQEQNRRFEDWLIALMEQGVTIFLVGIIVLQFVALGIAAWNLLVK